jgi:hypothetical protein
MHLPACDLGKRRRLRRPRFPNQRPQLFWRNHITNPLAVNEYGRCAVDAVVESEFEISLDLRGGLFGGYAAAVSGSVEPPILLRFLLKPVPQGFTSVITSSPT